MFWIAIANENWAAVTPMSRIICGWNRPRLWRMPIARLSISAAPPRIDQPWMRVSSFRSIAPPSALEFAARIGM